MNLIFNEISFLPYIDNEGLLTTRFLYLIELLKSSNKLFGFSSIVFPSDIGKIQVLKDKTFYQWAYHIPHQGDKNKILSQIKRPFINDLLEGRLNQLGEYSFENADLGIQQTYCEGLATAIVTERPSASLVGTPIWESLKISCQRIINDTFDTEQVDVFNIAREPHLTDPEFIQFVESISAIHLQESTVIPAEKPIHFRNDHGKDILTDFAGRLVKSVYVTAVINSLPFNSKTTRFLRNISADGIIEIVLHWEDAGYGMAIQTTGRNYRETKAISEILRKEYDR